MLKCRRNKTTHVNWLKLTKPVAASTSGAPYRPGYAIAHSALPRAAAAYCFLDFRFPDLLYPPNFMIRENIWNLPFSNVLTLTAEVHYYRKYLTIFTLKKADRRNLKFSNRKNLSQRLLFAANTAFKFSTINYPASAGTRV